MTTDDISGMGPLVARLSRGGQRLRHADRAHPWVLDTGVVLVVLLMFCLPDLLRGSVGNGDAPRRFRLAFTELPVAGMLALQAGLVLPLLWRRRKPMAAFGVIAAVFALQWSLGAALRADVALFIALYSLALHGRLRQLPWAGAVMAGAMLLVAVRASSAVSVWDALFFLLSTATAALALGLMVRIRRAQLAGLRERAARLEIERDQRSRLATATERTRVAREMHDIVGHNLSVIIIADIGALCATVRAAGLGVVYRTSGDVDALDGGVQLTVYRIVQEALTNTMKHAAGDARVHLAVVVTGARLSIRVQDTGPAARPGPPNEAGQGLVGMRERAALYGGTVSAGPTGGGGWSVEAVLDLTPQGGDR